MIPEDDLRRMTELVARLDPGGWSLERTIDGSDEIDLHSASGSTIAFNLSEDAATLIRFLAMHASDLLAAAKTAPVSAPHPDAVIADIERALNAAFPDRAAFMLNEVERWRASFDEHTAWRALIKAIAEPAKLSTITGRHT